MKNPPNGIVAFSLRLSAVAGAIIACVTVGSMLTRWATAGIHNEIVALRDERATADSLRMVKIDRLSRVVELAVIALVEPSKSEDRQQAVAELRRLRRVTQ